MFGKPFDQQTLYMPPDGGRRRRRHFLFAGALLAAVLAGCAVLIAILASRADQQSFDIPTAADPTATTEVGKPIRDEQIQFLVQSIHPLPTPPGAPAEDIQVVDLQVTNTGSSPQSVSIGDQTMIDDRGHDYHADPVISSQLNSPDGAISLQPGETASMSIPFDAPIDARPAVIVLRAGPSTPGVAVTLT
ncbi:MAG: DUF4352 domain-containing protein [Mycobacterium sp.]|nr:DUF4352 domain-containing protein [Mycobacterium sp.]